MLKNQDKCLVRCKKKIERITNASKMTNLYRLTPIEGKGFGIVASTFIKKGTVILEEKAQMPFLDDGPDLEAIRAETWMNWIKKILALYR